MAKILDDAGLPKDLIFLPWPKVDLEIPRVHGQQLCLLAVYAIHGKKVWA